MKLLRSFVAGFCALSGVVMAPVLVALLLAGAMGMLPSWERVRNALAQSDESEDSTSTRPSTSVDDESLPPAEVELWRQRLDGLRLRLDEDRRALEADRTALESERDRVAAAHEANARVTSALLGRSVTEADIAADPAAIVAELEKTRNEEERFPALLEAMSSIDPLALATIIAGDDEQEIGVEEKDVVRLLRALPARKTAQVFDELSRIDPALAGRLVEGMGAGSPVGDGPRGGR